MVLSDLTSSIALLNTPFSQNGQDFLIFGIVLHSCKYRFCLGCRCIRNEGPEVWLLCSCTALLVFHAIGISLVWVSLADPETLTSIPLKFEKMTLLHSIKPLADSLCSQSCQLKPIQRSTICGPCLSRITNSHLHHPADGPLLAVKF